MNPEYEIEADWVLNDFCNYSCDYCFFHSKKEHEKVGLISPEEYLDFFNSTQKTWLFHFTGGEPFFHPQFVDLCRTLSTSHFIALNSNLSAPSVYDFANKVDPSRVKYINGGLHVEQREQHEGVQKLLDVVVVLLRKGFTIFISSVMTPDSFDVFERVSDRFAKLGVPLIPKALRGFYNGKPYPESYSELERVRFQKFSQAAEQQITSEGSKFSSAAITFNPLLDAAFLNGFPNFLGIMCEAGKTFVRIKPDGEIYRCGMRTVVGNIFERKLDLFKGPRPCDDTCCPYICIKYTGLKLTELQELPRRVRIDTDTPRN